MNKKTEDSYEKVKNYILRQHMICDNDVIIAGVSGGADSVCLLFMLWKLSGEINFKLAAAHIHHGVRAEADDDASYVEALCKRLDVPFYIRKVDMLGYAKKMGMSPEEAGRRLRYEAFGEIIEKIPKEITGELTVKKDKPDKAAGLCSDGVRTGCKIAVAHNRNDKAETMLFNLFRGSGLRGLGSIRPVRDNIIRPLLCLERTEIEAYLKQNKIEFCIDSTNEDDTYTRNKIRHHILPYAKEQICGNCVGHISDAADILAETEAYIHKQVKAAYGRCTHNCEKNIHGEEALITLDLSLFLAEDEFMQKMILLYCMEKLTPHRKDITKEHIMALLRLSAKGGSKKFFLPYGLMAYKEYDRLVICRNGKKGIKEIENIKNVRTSDKCRAIPFSIPCSVPGHASVPGLGILEFKYLKKEEFFCKKGQIIPEKTYTKWFDCDKITRVLELRTRKAGDYLTIDSALKKKTIKEYMINEKIPRAKRESIYMLADGAHILWIPGYRISQYYKVDEHTKNILQVHLEEEANG